MGVQLKSDGPHDLNGELVRGKFFPHADYVEYFFPGKFKSGIGADRYALYIHGMDVEALPGSEVLVNKVLSYFDRTYKHFCSHRQTPSSGK